MMSARRTRTPKNPPTMAATLIWFEFICTVPTVVDSPAPKVPVGRTRTEPLESVVVVGDPDPPLCGRVSVVLEVPVETGDEVGEELAFGLAVFPELPGLVVAAPLPPAVGVSVLLPSLTKLLVGALSDVVGAGAGAAVVVDAALLTETLGVSLVRNRHTTTVDTRTRLRTGNPGMCP